MKKIYLLFAAIIAMYSPEADAQTLNQSADWPNPDWTITGSYNHSADAFEADPTTTANFAFDDDDAGQNHEDNIAAESPVIDLTAAHASGEDSIEVTAQYGYYYLDYDVLILQYWDADAAAWVDWGTSIPGNNVTVLDNFCSIPKTSFVSETLNIAGFTATQLSGFRYRISYNDSIAGTDWNYGFCFDSPSIHSISCGAPSLLAISNMTSDSADFDWTAITGITGFEYVLDNEATDPAEAGTAITENSYSASDLEPSTTYYFHVRTVCTSGVSAWRVISFTTSPPPLENDTCATAIDLNTQSSPLQGTTVNGGNESIINCNYAGEEIPNAAPDVYYSVLVPNGSTLTIGQTANDYDSTNIVFYGDCDNKTRIACFDDDDYTTVVWANDTGADQTVYWVQDGYNGNSGTFTLEWSVVACTNATATYSVVSDCQNGDQFLVDVEITSMGSATTLSVSDDQGSDPQTVSEPGIVQFGPYGNNTPVIMTVANDEDGACFITSPTLNQTICPPPNDTCATAIDLAEMSSPIEASTVGAHNDSVTNCNYAGEVIPNTAPDVYYSILVPAGSTLSIGQTDNDYDSTNMVFYGDCDNHTQIACFDDDDFTTVVWANDTGSDQTVYWVQDGYNGGSGNYTLDWYVIPCTNATAEYTVISDCANGEQFLIDVNITDLGSATSLSVYDDQGSTPQSVSSTGVLHFGPYGNGAPVTFTIANDQVGDCFVTSPPLNQISCPPANDNCAEADELTVNEDLECATASPGTLAGATDSGAGDNGIGTPDDDVWFKFTATSPVHKISLLNVEGSVTTYLVHEVFSGDCTELNSLNLNDTNGNLVSGLVVGDTYYVRVFTYGTDPSDTTFDICIGTPPPPPANDECANAQPLVPAGSFDDGITPLTNESATRNTADPDPTCDAYLFNTLGQDVWFSVVVPASGNITLETRSAGDDNIEDTGLEAFSGTCGALVHLGCNADDGDGNFSKLVLTGLTPGETILARTYGYGGAIGAYNISAYDESLLGTASFGNDGFRIYPNPVKDILNLSYTENISNVEVYNILGQQVVAKTVNANNSQVDMAKLPTGTYIVKVTADNQVKTIKVMKQ